MVWGGSTVLCLQRYHTGTLQYHDHTSTTVPTIGIPYAYIRTGYGHIHDSRSNAKTTTGTRRSKLEWETLLTSIHQSELTVPFPTQQLSQ
jgi:hypothetical protein